MNYKKLIEHFSESQDIFRQGAETLKKEAIENGFKLTVVGLQTFLDNCEIEADVNNFYQLCIPFAVESEL